MMKYLQLSNLIDPSIWISDDRISAQVSARSQTIAQIDFHGSQPVSRNAKLLQHARGVLSFHLTEMKEKPAGEATFSLETLSISPASFCQSLDLAGWCVELQVAVWQNSLIAYCLCHGAREPKEAPPFRFVVRWNRDSMSTEVHGDRSWKEPVITDSGLLLLQANDQIKLASWLHRHGDYQGDFLIPEGWRRMIFKRRCVSGTATWDDVREEYQSSSMNLYDADTWIQLGGEGFQLDRPNETQYRFQSDRFTLKKEHWLSPIFAVRFFHTKPPLQDDQPAQEHRPAFNLQQHRYQRIQRESPTLIWKGHDPLGEFFNQVPQIVESARVQDYGMTRACPGTYYWIWAWDNMVTALAQCHWGDLENVKRTVDFLRWHRDIDGTIPGRWTRHLEPMDGRGFGGFDFLFSELVLALYSETLDKQVLRANYAVLQQAFDALAVKAHDNGLFPTIGMYPDLPKKMARDESSYVAMDSGAWYTLCRNLEKIAWLLEDLPAAGRAAVMAGKVEANFLSVFWDEKRGFLCDSFHPATGVSVKSYPIFSLLFLESAFGMSLLREKLNRCSRFIGAQLLSETGLFMTPAWDMHHHSEPAMSAWYPHWDLAAVKLWLRDQNVAALGQWLALVEQCYQTLGYCPEFLSLAVPAAERWRHHGAAWNLNCAAGWYGAILAGVIGIERDLGGLTCFPIALSTSDQPTLKNFRFRKGKWEIRRSGHGEYLTSVRVDGKLLLGTHKIPACFYTAGEHLIEIEYGCFLPDRPVLLELIAAQLCDVTTVADGLIYSIHGFGCVDVSFSSPLQPRVLLDQKSVKMAWSPAARKAQGRLSLSGHHKLTVMST